MTSYHKTLILSHRHVRVNERRHEANGPFKFKINETSISSYLLSLMEPLLHQEQTHAVHQPLH